MQNVNVTKGLISRIKNFYNLKPKTSQLKKMVKMFE